MKSERLNGWSDFKLTGALLVASPRWVDSPFEKSVCLMVHHGSDGAIGVVLNRELPGQTAVLWENAGEKELLQLSGRLYLGGPHAGPVIAVHQRKDLAEYNPGHDVYFAAQAQNLKTLVSDPGCQWKIYVGQAAWGPGELDRQFSQGLWLPAEVNSRIVFDDGNCMWRNALRQIGNRLVESLAGITEVPSDLSYN
jgi:putative transcriptional regulator